MTIPPVRCWAWPKKALSARRCIASKRMSTSTGSSARERLCQPMSEAPPRTIESRPGPSRPGAWMDESVGGGCVLAGSFHFTKGAQEKHAENLLIICDKTPAVRYTQN
jgi:hypothetical protein